jgi:hypothetical protein
MGDSTVRSFILICLAAALAACSGVGHYQYDMVKVEANFKACMSATPTATEPNAFEHKIAACKDAAYATVAEKFVKP